MWLRGVANDEIGKISWVQIVKDFINCMNESELYPSGKEETMDIFKEGKNIMVFLFVCFCRKEVLAEKYVRSIGGRDVVGNVCNNPGKKNPGRW